MKKRVLILSTSAGTGHVRAAQALEKAFATEARVAAVKHADALDFTTAIFREFYSTLYMKLVRSAPDVLGWAYKASDEPWKGDDFRLQLDRLNTRPLVKMIRDFDPQITVCTHFMPAGIIAHLIAREELNTHHSIVVTDLDCHAMWLTRVFNRYFVAIDETKAHLEALGLPAERITVSGIPIDPIFAEPIDRAAVRAEFGLHAEKPTLLLSAGALGVGPTEFVVDRLMQLRTDAQTIVICGKSDELRGRIAAKVDARFHLLGYTNRMHDLMKISDLFIGKPGGLTTSEALACGLPMAIISPIPGQEDRNTDHLLEEGAAIKFNELTTIPFKIDRLLSNKARLATMRENARNFSHPNAAQMIVETLLKDHLPPFTLDSDQREAIAEAASRT